MEQQGLREMIRDNPEHFAQYVAREKNGKLLVEIIRHREQIMKHLAEIEECVLDMLDYAHK